MTNIDYITIMTFVCVAYVCVRYALFACRAFDTYERNNRVRECNITHYVGKHYNIHGREID